MEADETVEVGQPIAIIDTDSDAKPEPESGGKDEEKKEETARERGGC